MKKNPVIPYALIAVLGIALVIIISITGIDQKKDIQKAEEGGGDQQQEQSAEDEGEGASTDDPEAIFENTCASCHGADLSGAVGPSLQKVGGELSEDEIKDTIMNGKQGDIGTMPDGLVEEDQAEALAK